MKHYIDTVQTTGGTAIWGATVTVRVQNVVPGAGALATIYSDNGVTTIAGAVVTTNSVGRFDFWAPDGRYDFVVVASGGTPVGGNVTLGDIEIADVLEKFSTDGSWNVLTVEADNIKLDATNADVVLTRSAANKLQLASGDRFIPADDGQLLGESGKGWAITGTTGDFTGLLSAAGGITITGSPTFTDYTNAQHDHQDADDGGTLDAAAITGSVTGSGNIVKATSPTLTTPVLGVATGTSFQGIIGNVTPAAGTFTTLIGTTVDGPVGSVTPNTGAFTTLSASGDISPSANIVFSAASHTISFSNTGVTARNLTINGHSPATVNGGGQVFINGGAAAVVNTSGGALSIVGGAGNGTGNGGGVAIQGGAAGASGAHGSVSIGGAATSAVNIGASGVTTTTNGGLGQGTAFKFASVTTGSIAGGASAAVTLTFSGVFKNAAWMPVCSLLEATTTTSTIRIHHVESITNTTNATVVVRIVNDDGAVAKTGTLYCYGVSGP